MKDPIAPSMSCDPKTTQIKLQASSSHCFNPLQQRSEQCKQLATSGFMTFSLLAISNSLLSIAVVVFVGRHHHRKLPRLEAGGVIGAAAMRYIASLDLPQVRTVVGGTHFADKARMGFYRSKDDLKYGENTPIYKK